MPTAHIEGGLLPHLDGVRVVAGVSQLQCRSCHTWIGDGWQAVPSMQQCLLLSSAGSMLHAITDAAWLFLRYRVLVGRCFGVSTCVFALYGWIVSHGFCVCTRRVLPGRCGRVLTVLPAHFSARGMLLVHMDPVQAWLPVEGHTTLPAAPGQFRMFEDNGHGRLGDVHCSVCGSTAGGPHPQAMRVGGDHWAVSWSGPMVGYWCCCRVQR